MYHVNVLKYSLLSVSQICDKKNEINFSSDGCTVSSMKSGRIILKDERMKNMYVDDLESMVDGNQLV